MCTCVCMSMCINVCVSMLGPCANASAWAHVCAFVCPNAHHCVCVCGCTSVKTTLLLPFPSAPPGPVLGPQVTMDLRTQKLVGMGLGKAVRIPGKSHNSGATWFQSQLCPSLPWRQGLKLGSPCTSVSHWRDEVLLVGDCEGSAMSVCRGHPPLSPGWRPKGICLHMP